MIVKGDNRGEKMVRDQARIAAVAIVSIVLLYGCAEKDRSVFQPDLTPPQVNSISFNEGVVSWHTDEPATCVLHYGERPGIYDHYGYNVSDGGTDHFVRLVDADSGTYYFRILARDISGNMTTTDEVDFLIDEPQTGNLLVYTVVDVGWGDCNFLEFPNGTNVMIDAGYGSLGEFEHASDLFEFLNARGISPPDGIAYMIATHNHGDHYGGFLDLIPLYSETVFMAPAEPYSSVWASVGAKLDEFNVPRDSLAEGDTNLNKSVLAWDNEDGVTVEVLSAGAGKYYLTGTDDDRLNSDSIVLKVTFGEVDILLTGDAEDFVEQRMIKSYGALLDSDILKVGHHGNSDATSEEFLRIVTPRIGLISNSLAENDGVFDQSVLNLLRAYDVDYYTTDRAYPNAGRYDQVLHGNISVTTDGESYVVHVWN